jgi:hypothetical protein
MYMVGTDIDVYIPQSQQSYIYTAKANNKKKKDFNILQWEKALNNNTTLE